MDLPRATFLLKGGLFIQKQTLFLKFKITITEFWPGFQRGTFIPEYLLLKGLKYLLKKSSLPLSIEATKSAAEV